VKREVLTKQQQEQQNFFVKTFGIVFALKTELLAQM